MAMHLEMVKAGKGSEQFLEMAWDVVTSLWQFPGSGQML